MINLAPISSRAYDRAAQHRLRLATSDTYAHDQKPVQGPGRATPTWMERLVNALC